FETRGIPFYVGLGRDKRALDRVRYVRYMKKREASGKRFKWCLSSRVIAGLCGRGEEVHLRLVHKRLARARALVLEKRRIIHLVSSNFVLANCHYNPRRPASAQEVIRYLLERKRK